MIVDFNKVAFTSSLCSWKKCRRQAEPTPLININFKRPKQGQLLHSTQEITDQLIPFSYSDPRKNDASNDMKKQLEALKAIYPKAAVFTSMVDSSEDEDEGSETDTADESDVNCFPEPLTSLYESSATN